MAKSKSKKNNNRTRNIILIVLAVIIVLVILWLFAVPHYICDANTNCKWGFWGKYYSSDCNGTCGGLEVAAPQDTNVPHYCAQITTEQGDVITCVPAHLNENNEYVNSIGTKDGLYSNYANCVDAVNNNHSGCQRVEYSDLGITYNVVPLYYTGYGCQNEYCLGYPSYGCNFCHTHPPVTSPPVTTPPVTIPPVTIPPVTTPPVAPLTIPPIAPLTIPPIAPKSELTIAPLTIAPKILASVTMPPKIQAPITSAPKFLAPVTIPPKFLAPVTMPPKIQAPRIQAPKIQAPRIQAPKIQAPKIQAPRIQAPKIQAPRIQRPVVAPSAGKQTGSIRDLPIMGGSGLGSNVRNQRIGPKAGGMIR